MNLFSILRDGWYFYSRNLFSLALLCLPLIVLEAVLSHQIANMVSGNNLTLARLAISLVIYPLYSVPLILFLQARSDGQQPRVADLLAAGLRYWPSFALLTGLATTAIMLGASLFVLPGLWLMVKLAFAEYLLVVERHTPLQALHESFKLTTGCFWPTLSCVLIVMLPLWLMDAWSQSSAELANDALKSIALDSVSRFLQLFSSIVLFRLYMLRRAQSPASAQ
ncbi:YciC family protein [Ectopseudomonas mendocina]|uniref:YciC family protein n=1 Tax=Ectopseudomonas mendocina TaxID=300 RepID=A0ABZ2RHC4_ECTME